MSTATVPARRPSLVSALARIGVHRAWESIVQPLAHRLSDVPFRIEAVTAPWLTAALCAKTADAKVVSFRLGDGSAGTSVRRRIHLTYNDVGRAAGLPATVFAKSTPNALTRMANGYSGTMASEALFYAQLRPELSLEAPRGYHSAYDLRSYRSIHLLEDLVATKGATFCSPQTVINRRQANEIVDTLAAFHGHFFGDPRLKSVFGAGLRSYPQWFMDGDRMANLRPGHEKAMTKAADVIPADIRARREEIWPKLQESFADHAQHPATLLHSDVHLGNWYVTGTGGMGLCDWQCVNHGVWARDFAYAVSSTLTIQDRRAWERALLERYLGRLRACGQSIGLTDAWRLYRRQLPAALLMWTPTLCHSPLLPDMQPEATSIELIRRMTTAMSDLKALDAF
ncbi:phosphotransferase [uncultured Phenylobacterium sp.]|uniref:phosphotransferase n=1 Tax=uncultured Phenylobacterium sp. TaxID=349273 RepID=UPI0025DAA62D|nr:phosphotransferase [uncultured Phenylobacterium sp.]